MAKSKKEQIEIVAVTYKVGNTILTTQPRKKSRAMRTTTTRGMAGGVCTPGDTKCENGQLWRCFDIGEGQTDWLTAGETC